MELWVAGKANSHKPINHFSSVKYVFFESHQIRERVLFFFLFFPFLNWLYAISQRGERHLETPVAGSRCVSSSSLLSNLRLFTKDFIRHWFCGDDWLQFFHLAVFLTLGLLPLTPFLFCFFLYSIFHHCLFFFFLKWNQLCNAAALQSPPSDLALLVIYI